MEYKAEITTADGLISSINVHADDIFQADDKARQWARRIYQSDVTVNKVYPVGVFNERS